MKGRGARGGEAATLEAVGFTGRPLGEPRRRKHRRPKAEERNEPRESREPRAFYVFTVDLFAVYISNRVSTVNPPTTHTPAAHSLKTK